MTPHPDTCPHRTAIDQTTGQADCNYCHDDRWHAGDDIHTAFEHLVDDISAGAIAAGFTS